MELQNLSAALVQNIHDTTVTEIIAVVTGLLSVWFARKENILVYPVGIVSVGIYVVLCYSAGLYADMGINAFYFVMSIYGWIVWTRKNGESKTVLPISKLSNNLMLVGIVLTLVMAVILYYILVKFTDSTVPYLDSFTTAVFITGMYLMAVKKIENWIYWMVGDAICIFLFAYKGLVLSGFQYLIFLIIAISGYLEWSRRIKAKVEGV